MSLVTLLLCAVPWIRNGQGHGTHLAIVPPSFRSLTNVEGVSSWSGKQDPYARVAIGKQTYETRVHRSGGAVATWGDRYVVFKVSRKDAEE